MTADIELLPCPFCGASATLRHNYQWWVQCGECGVSTSDSAPMDRAGASAAWNRRANVAHATAAKDAEIEALREEVEAVWAAMPRDARYLDPPDGGCVPLHEQVRRMAADATRAERLAEALRLIESAKDRGFGIDYARGVAQSALRDHDQEVGNG